MGMSIDEAIHDTEVMKEYLECRGEIRSEGLGVAIETMRKYQQIEEIYKNWCYPTYFNATDAMNKLGEVLKDGKID